MCLNLLREGVSKEAQGSLETSLSKLSRFHVLSKQRLCWLLLQHKKKTEPAISSPKLLVILEISACGADNNAQP